MWFVFGGNNSSHATTGNCQRRTGFARIFEQNIHVLFHGGEFLVGYNFFIFLRKEIIELDSIAGQNGGMVRFQYS